MDRQFLHEFLYRGRDLDFLDDKRVTMLGCGALGSWTSILLARSGLKRFRLIDMDKVEIHNTSTQAFFLENLGQYKVTALSRILYRINRAKSSIYQEEITKDNVSLSFQDSDLVICTFDNYISRKIVRDKAVELGFPTVFGAMNGNLNYGEVVWAEGYDPPSDPPRRAIDPCEYPLSTTLVLLTSSILAEVSLRYLINGEKISPFGFTLTSLLYP
ncbi:MAG: hypothetical protein DRO36_06990 [Candidatus Hecatellales archaeon]|nr:MAG: hypothetical protein DRO36_06990 [Candidatus Hecatellales archaeon]